MSENERDILEKIEEIKQISNRIEDELTSINITLKFLDIDQFNDLVEKIKEKKEELGVIKDKEEKLQNVYDKLIVMINECKGLVATSRVVFKARIKKKPSELKKNN